MKSHGLKSHGKVKSLIAKRNRIADPQNKNQMIQPAAAADGRQIDRLMEAGVSGAPGQSAIVARGVKWCLVVTGGERFPRRGGLPPLQGEALLHRSVFSQPPQGEIEQARRRRPLEIRAGGVGI